MKIVTTFPDLREVALNDSDRAILRRAAAALRCLRVLIGDEDHPMDTDIALAAGVLGDLAEEGTVLL